jgi:hypothetical protein
LDAHSAKEIEGRRAAMPAWRNWSRERLAGRNWKKPHDSSESSRQIQWIINPSI